MNFLKIIEYCGILKAGLVYDMKLTNLQVCWYQNLVHYIEVEPCEEHCLGEGTEPLSHKLWQSWLKH